MQALAEWEQDVAEELVFWARLMALEKKLLWHLREQMASDCWAAEAAEDEHRNLDTILGLVVTCLLPTAWYPSPSLQTSQQLGPALGPLSPSWAYPHCLHTSYTPEDPEVPSAALPGDTVPVPMQPEGKPPALEQHWPLSPMKEPTTHCGHHGPQTQGGMA